MEKSTRSRIRRSVRVESQIRIPRGRSSSYWFASSESAVDGRGKNANGKKVAISPEGKREKNTDREHERVLFSEGSFSFLRPFRSPRFLLIQRTAPSTALCVPPLIGCQEQAFSLPLITSFLSIFTTFLYLFGETRSQLLRTFSARKLFMNF